MTDPRANKLNGSCVGSSDRGYQTRSALATWPGFKLIQLFGNTFRTSVVAKVTTIRANCKLPGRFLSPLPSFPRLFFSLLCGPWRKHVASRIVRREPEETRDSSPNIRCTSTPSSSTKGSGKVRKPRSSNASLSPVNRLGASSIPHPPSCSEGGTHLKRSRQPALSGPNQPWRGVGRVTNFPPPHYRPGVGCRDALLSLLHKIIINKCR